MTKHSWLRLLKTGILIILLGFCIIELTRIIETQISLDWMARQGVRYAASGQYSYEFCRNPATLAYAVRLLKTENISTTVETLASLQKIDCVIEEQPGKDDQIRYAEKRALSAAAAYYSIQNMMWKTASNVINPRFLQSTICSDRPGFIYDPAKHLCSPIEDVGNPSRSGGSKVIVSLAYSYQLGSSIGLNLVEIPFYVVKESSIEKYR